MNDRNKPQLEKERAEVIIVLRELCARFGDNDWPDDLNLSDVIEKHLAKRLYIEFDTANKRRDH